jgi:hypothetical protein
MDWGLVAGEVALVMWIGLVTGILWAHTRNGGHRH